jgi:hypothetical protein
MSPLNILTRVAQLEAGFDLLAHRIKRLETGKFAPPPPRPRGRPPGSRNRPKPAPGTADPPRDLPEAIPS